jgi:hypothetical protein
MSTLIHFIGLVTLVTATSEVPQHILIPRFDIIPAKNNVISIPTAAVVAASTNWATSTEDVPAGFTHFLIGEQSITINGAGGLTQSSSLEMPHLTCCCPAMREGLSLDYDSPDPAREVRKSAYVRLEHGSISQYVDQDNAIHIDLEVTPVTGTSTITITGVRHETTQTIVVDVSEIATGQHIVFRNQPDNPAAHDAHWTSYYQMGSNANAVQCAETPGNDSTTCGPRSTNCLTTAAVKPKKQTAAQKKQTAAHMRRMKKLHAGCKVCLYGFGDINCSSSSWP